MHRGARDAALWPIQASARTCARHIAAPAWGQRDPNIPWDISRSEAAALEALRPPPPATAAHAELLAYVRQQTSYYRNAAELDKNPSTRLGAGRQLRHALLSFGRSEEIDRHFKAAGIATIGGQMKIPARFLSETCLRAIRSSSLKLMLGP